ncbi:MAG: CdaR family protein [Clostridia bacterium]
MKKSLNWLKNLFTKDRSLIITSLLIAIAFWFYVVGVYAPETAKVIRDVPLTATLSKTANLTDDKNIDLESAQEKLMILKGTPATVDVVVDGLRTELGTLSSDDIKAEIDFSTITGAGEYELPVKVKLPSQYKLVSVNPDKVVVKIEKKITMGIEVAPNTTGKVKDGYALESIKSVPAIISVTGPEMVVTSIKKAVANIDITDANDVVAKKSSYTLLDKNGTIIDMTNITTDVSQVLVTANVFKSKIVPFTAKVINSSGGSDENFSTVNINPKEIEIVGSSSIIDSINSIDLGVVDMAEATTKGQTFTIEIVIPNGVKALTPVTKATVNVTYPELSTKTLNIKNFEFVGANAARGSLPNGYSVSVKVRGVASDLDALNESMIKGTIAIPDVAATGKTQITITFNLPSESKTSVIGKYNAIVTIK